LKQKQVRQANKEGVEIKTDKVEEGGEMKKSAIGGEGIEKGG